MKAQLQNQTKTSEKSSFAPAPSRVLQRQCACSNHTMAGGECAECTKNKSSFQRKLAIGASHDPLEQEADRIADQVMATPVHSTVSGAPPRIQRFSGQSSGQMDAAPASVDQALANPGQPLDASTRAYFEPRFGYDFSQVRVHSGTSAEQSAQDVNANAYTARQDIVFGAGRFAPGTHDGRRLIAHELTHVVQQSGLGGVRLDQSDEKHGMSPISQRTSTPQLQRQPSRQQVGTREATVDVRWSEDDVEFYHRLMAALISSSGFSGIDASNLRSASYREPGFLAKTKEFHIRYAISHSDRKADQQIKVHVSAYFDPSRDISALAGIKISSGEKPVVDTSVQKASTSSTTTTPAPVLPTPLLKPPVCTPPPAQSSPGKRCKFYVYDSTEPTWLGKWGWRRAALGLATFRPGAYVIPSGESIEEALKGILDTYADKDCGCIDEFQFFSHGSPGNAWSITEPADELTSKDFNIPGLDQFGYGPTSMPGYREWTDKLSVRQRRLVLLRRVLCGPGAEIYYRSCEAFQGKVGQEFAKASTEFWRSKVVGHTKVIRLPPQPGRKVLELCQEPYWSESEGTETHSP